jgi:hypothetical protein
MGCARAKDLAPSFSPKGYEQLGLVPLERVSPPPPPRAGRWLTRPAPDL